MFKKTEMDVEAMVRRRRHLLIGGIAIGGPYIGAMILRDFTPSDAPFQAHWGHLLNGVYVCASAGFIAWIVYLMLFVGHLRRNPTLRAVVGDEMFQQIRSKATGFAFVTAMICQIVIVQASFVYPFPARLGAAITMFVAVISLFSALLVLERQADAS